MTLIQLSSYVQSSYRKAQRNLTLILASESFCFFAGLRANNLAARNRLLTVSTLNGQTSSISRLILTAFRKGSIFDKFKILSSCKLLDFLGRLQFSLF